MPAAERARRVHRAALLQALFSRRTPARIRSPPLLTTASDRWESWSFGYRDLRIRFLTGTPLDIRRGSGTYVGMDVLARAIRGLGHTVDFETPRIQLAVYTAQRLLFNR